MWNGTVCKEREVWWSGISEKKYFEVVWLYGEKKRVKSL